MPLTENQDPRLRLQVLKSLTIRERGAVAVAGQLLSGDLDSGRESVLRSEELGDLWQVQRAEIFGSGSGEGYFRALQEGRRSLWFRPVKDLRPIKEGEIFTRA